MNEIERKATEWTRDPRILWSTTAVYLSVPIGILLGRASSNVWIALVALFIASVTIRMLIVFAIAYGDGRSLRKTELMIETSAAEWKRIQSEPHICELCRKRINGSDHHHVFRIDLYSSNTCPFMSPPGRVCDDCAPRVSEMICAFAKDAGFSFMDPKMQIHNPLKYKSEAQ